VKGGTPSPLLVKKLTSSNKLSVSPGKQRSPVPNLQMIRTMHCIKSRDYHILLYTLPSPLVSEQVRYYKSVLERSGIGT